MSSDDIVITGYSLVSPIGSTIKKFEENLFKGKSGINHTLSWSLPPKSIGLMDLDQNLNLSIYDMYPYLLDEFQKTCKFPHSLSGVVASSVPTSATVENLSQSFADPLPFYFDSHAQFLRDQLNRKGCDIIDPTQIIFAGGTCSSAHIILGMAAQRIRMGLWKNALVTSLDLRVSFGDILPLHALGILSTRQVAPEMSSCPFSKERDGCVKSQGGGFILLEKRSDAESRGQKILGTLRGFSHTTDGWRHTDQRPDVKGTTQAMKLAVESANLTLEDISCISAHGTSTNLNDALETRAIQTLFGTLAQKIPITALKSQIGHNLVSAGMTQSIAALLMLKNQKIPATINYKIPDPVCNLDYVPNSPRSSKLDYILCNGFGLGGQNACLVFGKGE